jgi:hypothetical protein
MGEEQNDCPRVIELDLRPWAIREIRRLATADGGVVVASVVRERTAESGLFSYDILHILRTGKFEGQPVSDHNGGFLCRIVQRVRKRKAVVEAVIFGEDSLFVTKCDWEGKP